MSSTQPIFISRAGADADFAAEIGRILEEAGHEVILQQWDFANRNFMERMHDALSRGARVIALLSPEYLRSKHCSAEWQNTLADDPLNERRRLVVLRVVECVPDGLLAGLAYWDLVPIREDRALLRELVVEAVGEGRRDDAAAPAGPYWRSPSVILDPEVIRETPSFTGREDELRAIATALESGARTIVYGLGGTGKSSLLREFAWRHRERFSVIAWLDAETENGIIEGFIRLGSLFVRGLDEVTDRQRAAQRAKTTLLSLSAGLRKPILLLFDNVSHRRLLNDWAPREGVQVLASSRNADWGGGARTVPLSAWPLDDAVRYLSAERGAELTGADARAIAERLDGLPLALAHAAAHLGSVRTVTARNYLLQIERHMARAPDGAEYPRAVFATFQEALAKAEQLQPGAASLLCLAAHFGPDAIPESLFANALGASGLRPPLPDGAPAADLGSTLADAFVRDEALGALDRLSLVRFAVETRTFSVHRLVQAAARDLVRSDAVGWVQIAVASANAEFPADPLDVATWPQSAALLPHAQAALVALPKDAAFAPAGDLADRCGDYLCDRADFEEAERLLRLALAVREAIHGSDHPDVAQTLNNLAGVLVETNRSTEAEALYRRALAIREASYGPDHPDVAIVLSNLASLFQETNRHSEAEPLYRRALAILKGSYGPDHTEAAQAFNNLANLLVVTNRFAEAEPLYRHALAIVEKSFGEEHPDVAIGLNNLARLLRDTNRLAEAEPLFRRAAATLAAVYGTGHPEIATVHNNLANVLRDLNRPAEAETLLRDALEMREKSYGPEHPRVAQSLNNLANLLRDANRSAEAERLYRRALSIFEASFGPEHPRDAETLNGLAILLSAGNRFAEAEPLFRRALAIREASHGTNHPDVAQTLNDLANLLDHTGRFAAAESLLRRALAILEASYGADHIRVGDALNDLAIVLGNVNRFDEAEALYRRALAIGEASYGPNHPEVAKNLNNLALLMHQTNRSAEAEPLYRRALALLEAAYGADHPNVAIGLSNLANLLRRTGRSAEGEELLRRALVILEAGYGPEHFRVGKCLNSLANLLRDAGRFDEAEPLYRRAFAIAETSLGPEHPQVAETLGDLALLLRETGRPAEASPLLRRALSIGEAVYGSDHPKVVATRNDVAQSRA
ncbi:MAG: tetratricopeptide repeat protein [Candidatus Eremiobacteraeota bacterium]|nr:tetratricopeptide repeat protein [Candidatus Eremiobacteraeota bacterium]